MAGTAGAPGPDAARAPRARINRSEKVSQNVAREIVREIVEQGLQPGAMLPPEAVMLESLGVGRGSLREALRMLEIQGLVSMKPGPGGGPVVGESDPKYFARSASLHFQISGATFADLLTARQRVEPMMIRDITDEQDPEVMARVRELLAQECDPSNDKEYLDYASALHRLATTSSTNQVLNTLSAAVNLIYAQRIPSAVVPHRRRAEIIDEHRAVMRAMLRGRGDQAEKLMREHAERQGTDVRRRFPGVLDERVTWY